MKRWLDIFEGGFSQSPELSAQSRILAEAIRKDVAQTPGFSSKVTLAQDVKMGVFPQLLSAIREEAEREVLIHLRAGTEEEKALSYGVEAITRFFSERYSAAKLPILKSLGVMVMREK